MKEAAVKQQIIELSLAIETLACNTEKQTQDLYLCDLRWEKTNTDELLDHLRMQLRYVLFDLQATRRENKYLRKMLEARNKRQDDTNES